MCKRYLQPSASRYKNYFIISPNFRSSDVPPRSELHAEPKAWNLLQILLGPAHPRIPPVLLRLLPHLRLPRARLRRSPLSENGNLWVYFFEWAVHSLFSCLFSVFSSIRKVLRTRLYLKISRVPRAGIRTRNLLEMSVPTTRRPVDLHSEIRVLFVVLFQFFCSCLYSIWYKNWTRAVQSFNFNRE